MYLVEQIAKGEGKTTEFNRELPGSGGLVKTIAAFANTGGGRLIVGINDDGTIEGVEAQRLASDMERISNMLRDKLQPFFLPNVYSFAVEDKSLIVIEVFPSPIPPHFIKSEGKEKGTYIRVGSVNKKAGLCCIQELERRKLRISYDALPNRGMSVSDEQTLRLKELLQERTGIELSSTDLINKRLMVRESGEIYYTNAAAILMGVHKNVKIKCIHFKGGEDHRFTDRRTFEGDLFSQLDDSLNFLLSHIKPDGEIGADGGNRADTGEIPPEALREALLNAVIHRTYSTMNSDIKAAVYDDRVEITSPGDLPNGIMLEEALAGRSEIRNRAMADLFECAQRTGQWGRGIRTIFNSCAATGQRHPEILESEMFVQVRFYRERQMSVPEGTKRVQAKRTGRTGGTYRGGSLALPGSSSVTIKTREKQIIIGYLTVMKSASASQIMKHLGLGKTRTVFLLTELVEEGKLLREGRSRAVRYRLNRMK